VDHAWTFQAEDAVRQLTELPQLRARVAAMAGVRLPGETREDGVAGADFDTDEEEEEEEEEERLLRPRAWRGGVCESNKTASARVLSAAQRLLGCYRLEGQPEPTWFLGDELGSALRHSAWPSCATAPFLYAAADGDVAYTLLWPLRALAEGEELTRDYVAGAEAGGPPRDHVLACFFRGRADAAAAAWLAFQRDAASASASPPTPPPLPALPRPPPPPVLRVWTDIDWVRDELRRPDFAHVGAAAEADVLWTKAPLDAPTAAAAGASAECMLNQFPGEESLGTFPNRSPPHARSSHRVLRSVQASAAPHRVPRRRRDRTPRLAAPHVRLFARTAGAGGRPRGGAGGG